MSEKNEIIDNLTHGDTGTKPSPKISVIVPVYKVEKYLPECIESVLAQTFTDFELILVDDGSPDNSGKICDAYAARDSRIRVFHKENGGVVSARMCGLWRSHGDYVIFLDGDDTWTRTALSGLWTTASDAGADFVRGGFFYESEDREIYHVVVPELRGVFDVGDLLSRSFKTIFDYTAMCVWGNLYRRKIALAAAADVGGVRINHSEDGLFAAAAFLHSRKIAFSRDPFYYYLQRDGSAVHRFNPRVVEAQEGFCAAMEMILKKSGKVSSARIVEILKEHALTAVAYTWGMLFRAPSFTKMLKLLHALRKSRFFWNANTKASSMKFKRRFLLALLGSDLATMSAYTLKRIIKNPFAKINASVTT